MQISFPAKRVLVVGGTGFVGSRLVERLMMETKAEVRVLVRNYGNAVRIARFPIEMVRGSITEPADVERAAEGCDVIFHCAYGNTGGGDEQRKVTVDGTANVMAAAQKASAERVVYLSTVSVYGRAPDGDLDESATRRYSGGGYADTKLDAEKIAMNYAKRGLPVVTLQPTIIYGPFGPLWTIGILERLKAGGITVIEGGAGLCNIVYVDDVVNAMLLAATKPEAAGEDFLISGEQPVTWREFYEAFEKMLGLSSRIVSLTTDEAKAHYRQKQSEKRIFKQLQSILREDEALRDRIITTPEAMKLLRTTRPLLPKGAWRALKRRLKGDEENSLWPLVSEADGKATPEAIHPLDVELSKARTRVRIDKAKRLLGYQPVYDFDSGMRSTEEWARWANLLN
ncbi:MAG: NAD-dependent epimerase/dehydratase family protein [Pyrinomonadaceae bacterium]